MDKVTRQCPQTSTFFEEKGEPKRYRTEVLPLTSLTPYRSAKPAHANSVYHYEAFLLYPPTVAYARVDPGISGDLFTRV